MIFHSGYFWTFVPGTLPRAHPECIAHAKLNGNLRLPFRANPLKLEAGAARRRGVCAFRAIVKKPAKDRRRQ
jgi:hypothetical protein